MDLASSGINAAVVAAVGIVLAWLGKGRLDAQDRRLDRLEGRLGGGFESLDAKIEGVEQRLEQRLGARMDSLDARIDGVELRLGARMGALDAGSDGVGLLVGSRHG